MKRHTIDDLMVDMSR